MPVRFPALAQFISFWLWTEPACLHCLGLGLPGAFLGLLHALRGALQSGQTPVRWAALGVACFEFPGGLLWVSSCFLWLVLKQSEAACWLQRAVRQVLNHSR